MTHPRLLLLLLIPFATRTGLSLKLYKAKSIFSYINTALSKAKGLTGKNSLLEKRSFKFPLPEGTSSNDDKEEVEAEEEEEEEKRTFPAVTRYKYLAQAQGKRKVYQRQAKSDRRTKVTLSLDVPTDIMNILFSIAKAEKQRAQAAANAELMAQIGRRK